MTVRKRKTECYSVEDIRRAFDRHASNDDWGVPSMYVEGLISALRGEYEDAER